MWNADVANRLHMWYTTDEGTFALRREYLLFQRLVSEWPRRGHSLLDVACGTGVFLEMLWEYGFDVTGLDPAPDNLKTARERLGHRAEFRLGQPDYLPFDDQSMDYVSLISLLEYVENPKDVLAEALRVASRGVVVGFMNSTSLYHALQGPPWPWIPPEKRRSGLWINSWRLARLVREIDPDVRISVRSVLVGPPGGWKEKGLLQRVNALEIPFPLGAYAAMRIDRPGAVPLTPLCLSAGEERKKEQEACAACSSTI